MHNITLKVLKRPLSKYILLITKSRDWVRLNPGISGLENFRDPGIPESRDSGIAIPTACTHFGARFGASFYWTGCFENNVPFDNTA